MTTTPTPWKYSKTHLMSHDTWYVVTDANGFGPIVEVGGKDKNGQIAEAKYLVTDPKEIEANAELIVRCVNSHTALVEALEACQARLGCGCGGDFGLCNRCSEVYDAIDKALIQAKGGA